MKVVILAGGKGTRLGLTDRPKPMALVAGKPLLERLVEGAVQSGLKELIFLNGHLAEVIEDYFGDGSTFGVKIEHVRESGPIGTAGAVSEARSLLKEPFILLYGDVLMDVDLGQFARYGQDRGGFGTLFAHPNDHPFDSDLLVTDEAGRVRQLVAKPHPPGAILPNLVNAAAYFLDPSIIDFVPDDRPTDWAKDIFPAVLAAGGALYAYRSVEYVKDMGTPDRIAIGEADLKAGRVARLSLRRSKPAIFIDRDGVLNRELDGVHRHEELVVIDGVGPSIRRVNRRGIPAICVTNQPDLAKGMMSMDDLEMIFAALDTQLAKDGAYLDDVYFCPHHPERGFAGEVAELKVECDCRKPKPGMLLKAAAAHNLDLGASWMIGDTFADLAAAKAVGARGVLVKTGHAGRDHAKFDLMPDHVADDLPAAVDYVLGQIE